MLRSKDVVAKAVNEHSESFVSTSNAIKDREPQVRHILDSLRDTDRFDASFGDSVGIHWFIWIETVVVINEVYNFCEIDPFIDHLIAKDFRLLGTEDDTVSGTRRWSLYGHDGKVIVRAHLAGERECRVVETTEVVFKQEYICEPF